MIGLTNRQHQNGILILTSFHGLLGSDEEDMLSLNGILILTSLKGVLGSDKQDKKNKKRCPHFD